MAGQHQIEVANSEDLGRTKSRKIPYLSDALDILLKQTVPYGQNTGAYSEVVGGKTERLTMTEKGKEGTLHYLQVRKRPLTIHHRSKNLCSSIGLAQKMQRRYG